MPWPPATAPPPCLVEAEMGSFSRSVIPPLIAAGLSGLCRTSVPRSPLVGMTMVFKEALLYACICIFRAHILFLVTTRAGLKALMLKKLCFLIQLTAAVLCFPGFLPLSETLCLSSCPASKGLLCSDWPVQTHTFQMNV